MKRSSSRQSQNGTLLILTTTLLILLVIILAMQSTNAEAAPLTETADSLSPELVVPSTITIGSGIILVSDPINVPIDIDVPAPNLLAAATIRITFDPAVVSYVGCNTNDVDFTLNLCNLSMPNEVSFSAISVSGVNGTINLGSIDFTGLAAGTSLLTISAPTFTDGSGEAPILNNGSIQVDNTTAITLQQMSAEPVLPENSATILILSILVISVGTTSYLSFRKRRQPL